MSTYSANTLTTYNPAPSMPSLMEGKAPPYRTRLNIGDGLINGLRILALGAAPVLMPDAVPAAISQPGPRRSGWQLILEGSENTQVIPMLTAAVAKSLYAQEQSLLALQPDWDGYGAEPIKSDVIKTLASELREAIAGINGRVPELVPGADGTLQAEWYLPTMRVFYQISADRTRFLFVVSTQSGEEFVYSGEDARANLRQVILAIKRADEQFTAGQSI